jgi:hypothetical protein
MAAGSAREIDHPETPRRLRSGGSPRSRVGDIPSLALHETDLAVEDPRVVGLGDDRRDKYPHVDPIQLTCGDRSLRLGLSLVTDRRSSVDRLRPVLTRSSALSDARPVTSARDVILFVSSNGAGVGHLMRLMAMARRANPRIQPLFVTMSQAVPVVHRMGFVAEYIPSQGHTGMPTPRWHELLRTRLEEIVDTHQPIGLVFDGTWPYRGLLQVKQAHRDLPFVWSRRGMWRPETRTDALETSPWFDLIVEPGDFADEIDVGPTSQRRHEVKKVGPILYLDEEELLPCKAAKAELGLDPDRSAALVQLGAGNINDVTSIAGMVVRALAEEPSVQAALAESAISSYMALEFDVKRFSVYPLARYLRAFDFAVGAAGYNTFHELVGFGVPTIFIPNLQTRADDQGARADHAERTGVGRSLHHPDPASIATALKEMLDPDVRQRMAGSARELFPGNGAPQAMTYIEELCLRASTDRPGTTADPARPMEEPPLLLPGARRSKRAAEIAHLPRYHPRRLAHGIEWRLTALSRFVARWIEGRGYEGWMDRMQRAYTAVPEPLKHPLRPLARSVSERIERHRRPPRVMVVLDDPSSVDLLPILRLFDATTLGTEVEQVFVTFDRDFSVYRRLGVPFEYLLGRDAWEQIRSDGAWEEYVARRIHTLVDTYEPDHVIHVSPGARLKVLEGAIRGLVGLRATDVDHPE